MRIYMMVALVLVSCTPVARANQEGGVESFGRGPLPQALYDLREPETVQARSLSDAMRARRLERSAPTVAPVVTVAAAALAESVTAVLTAAPASGPRALATVARAPSASWAVLASAVVPGDPRALNREAARAARLTVAVSQPTAVFATHVGSDVMPVRPGISLKRNDSASALPGACKRCGEKVAESYAVLCLECRAQRASR